MGRDGDKTNSQNLDIIYGCPFMVIILKFTSPMCIHCKMVVFKRLWYSGVSNKRSPTLINFEEFF